MESTCALASPVRAAPLLRSAGTSDFDCSQSRHLGSHPAGGIGATRMAGGIASASHMQCTNWQTSCCLPGKSANLKSADSRSAVSRSVKPRGLRTPRLEACGLRSKESRGVGIPNPIGAFSGRNRLSTSFLGQRLSPHRRNPSCQKTLGRRPPLTRSSWESFNLTSEGFNLNPILSTFESQAHAALALAGGLFAGFGGLEKVEGWEAGIATATGITAGALVSWALAKKGGDPPQMLPKAELVSVTDNDFNRFVSTRTPLIGQLVNGPSAALSKPNQSVRNLDSQIDPLKYRRHCVRLADGGHLALDWPGHLALSGMDGRDSVVVIVPGGVEGSLDEGVKTLVRKAMDVGHFPVVLNQRGFAQSPVTTTKLFNAGATADLAETVAFLREQRPDATITAVGFGSGANLVVKYLGDRNLEAPSVAAAVAVGCPFDLAASTDHLTRPGNTEHGAALAKERADLLRQHLPLFEGQINGVEAALGASSVGEFDELFTARANGFATREAYYSAASCGGHVATVDRPVLFIQGDADVEAPAAAIPRAAIHDNPCASLLLTRGGHDVSEKVGGWTADVVLEWLAAVELALLKQKEPCFPGKTARIAEGVSVGERGRARGNNVGLTSANGRHVAQGGGREQSGPDITREELLEQIGTVLDQQERRSAAASTDDNGRKGLEVSDGGEPGTRTSSASRQPDTGAEGAGVSNTAEDTASRLSGTPARPPVSDAGEEREPQKSGGLEVSAGPTGGKENRKEERENAVATRNMDSKSVSANEAAAGAKEPAAAGTGVENGNGNGSERVGKKDAAKVVGNGDTESATHASSVNTQKHTESGGATDTQIKGDGSRVSEEASSGADAGEVGNPESGRHDGEKQQRAGPDSALNRKSDGGVDSNSNAEAPVEGKKRKGKAEDGVSKDGVSDGTEGTRANGKKDLATSAERTGSKPEEKKPSGSQDESKAEGGEENAPEEPPPPPDAKGIATATAESFLNVADVALPGTLSEDKKQQVVAAVNNGESLASALDLAVPPDVRMKVTGAVQTYMVKHKGQAGEFTAQIDMDRVSGLFTGQGGSLVSKITGGLKGNLAPPRPKPADPSKGSKTPPSKSEDSKSPPPKADGASSSKPSNPPADGAAAAPARSDAPPSKDSSAKGGESKPAQAESSKSAGDGAPANPPPQSETPKSDSGSSPNQDALKVDASPKGGEKGGAPPPQNETGKSGDPPKPADAAKDSTSPPPQNANAAAPSEGDAGQGQSGGGAESGQPSGEAASPPPPSDAAKDSPPPPKADDGAVPPPTAAESASQAAAAVTPALNADAATAPAPPAAAPPGVPIPPPSIPNVGTALSTLDQGFDDGTQRAVHNVFGVLEGVIDTLEAAEGKKEADSKTEPETEKKTEAVAVVQTDGGKTDGAKGAERAGKAQGGSSGEKSGTSGTTGTNGTSGRNGTGGDGGATTVVATKVHTESGEGRVENGVRIEATGRNPSTENGTGNGRVGVAVQRTVTEQQPKPSRREGVNGTAVACKESEGLVVRTGAVVVDEKPPGKIPEGAAKGGSIEENRQRLQRQYDTESPPAEKPSGNGAGNGAVRPQSLKGTASEKAAEVSPAGETPGAEAGEQSEGGVLQAVAGSPPMAAVTTTVNTVGSTAAAVAQGLPAHRKLEVADVILTSIKLEIGRRIGQSGFDAMTRVNWEAEAGRVAEAVAEAIAGPSVINGLAAPPGPNAGQAALGTEAPGTQPGTQSPGLDVGKIMQAIGSVVGTGGMFGGLLPMGVLVGIVVAAVGTLYHVVQDKKKEREEKEKAEEAAELQAEQEVLALETEDDIAMGLGTKWDEEPEGESGVAEIDPNQVETVPASSTHKGLSTEQTATIIGAGGVVVAAAAAVASSATGVTAQDLPQTITATTADAQNRPEGGGGLSDTMGHLATQAVAVVKSQIPRDASGDVDQERLVMLLADAGGRGGVFRIAGKLALFWGGVRGASRVTERLLGFLKIDQKNLAKRMFVFALMSVILWSPVLLPLLPTILQHKATGGQGGVAEAAAVAGLYAAVLLLIHIWGRVVRRFERPFTAYGLRMLNRKSARQLITGQLAGVFLVGAFYALQLRLGHVTWVGGAAQQPAANAAARVLQGFGKVHLVLHAYIVGFAVSLVEELIFRSWIHEEAAVDVGPHGAALLSTALFSVVHWSRAAAPGLFFLGLVLLGARARARGNLALPMGLHSGLIAANYVVQVGQLTAVNPRVAFWLTGGGNPLVSALGVGMTAVMALGLYPWGKGLVRAENPVEVAAEMGVTEEEAVRQIQEHGQEEESELRARIDELGGQETPLVEGGGQQVVGSANGAVSREEQVETVSHGEETVAVAGNAAESSGENGPEPAAEHVPGGQNDGHPDGGESGRPQNGAVTSRATEQ